MKLSARWIPALLAPVVVAGAIAVPMLANAGAPLPEKSAAEVLAMVPGSAGTAYSGELSLTSNLGLPDLGAAGSPVRAGTGADDPVTGLVELLTGTHTVRVFTDGGSGQRVQVLDSLAERDLVRSGSDVWAYDSAKNSAYHASLPAAGERQGTPAPSASPVDAARQLLDGIAPYTDVSVATTDTVAGRSVYELRLVPKSSTTLVSAVSVAVDAQTGLPLRVAIDGRSGTAVSLEFTSIDVSAPDSSLFSFTPPAGASVTEVAAPGGHPQGGAAPGSRTAPTVTGSGWDTIVELPAGTVDLSALAGAQSGLLDKLTTPVGSGRAIETSLVSVLVTGDGRVLVGAVPLSALEAAAG